MAQEIERKFLVTGSSFKAQAYAAKRIVQAYLVADGKRTVRVRIRDNQGFLTIKGPSRDGGLSRFEWEKEIPVEEARELLLLAQPGAIDKTRYLVKNTDGVHTWEVDEFHGDNSGLVMAEIEMASEIDRFDKPDWLGEEVTGDRRYYNAHLTANPYIKWKNEPR